MPERRSPSPQEKFGVGLNEGLSEKPMFRWVKARGCTGFRNQEKHEVQNRGKWGEEL